MGFRHGRLAAEIARMVGNFLAEHPNLGVVVHLVGIIEPGARAVRVYSAEGPEQRLRADHGDVLRAEALMPGFALPLAELFDLIR